MLAARKSSRVRALLVGGIVASAIGACSRSHSHSGDDDSGGSNPIDPEPNLLALFAGQMIDSAAPKVGFVAPDDDDGGVALSTPIVVVFSESMDSASINGTSFTLTDLGGGSGGGGGFPGGGGGDGGIPGIGFSGGKDDPGTSSLFGDDRFPDGDGGDGTDGDGTDGDGTDGETPTEPPVGTPVAGSVVADPDTNRRAFLFLPSAALEEDTDYAIRLGNTIADTEGIPIETESSEDDGGDVGAGLTGVAVERTFRTVSDADAAEFQVVAMYPRPDETNVPVDTIVKIYFNMPVDAKILPDASKPAPFQSLQLYVNGSFVTAAPFKVDRLAAPGLGTFSVRLKPKTPFPQNATVRVVVHTNAVAANGKQVNDGDEKFEATFRTTAVPTPVAAIFPESLPVTVSGIGYDGSLGSSNVGRFKTDVTLAGTGDADTVTILFFQAGAVGSAPIARTITKAAGASATRFLADLSGGKDGTIFAQSNSQTPALPVVVGAFATRDGLNSPVGPVVLPDLFVETSRPKIEFGPPSPSGKLSLATTLAAPAFYGKASEPLKSLRVVLGATSTPISYVAIKLGDESEVTGAEDFFITDTGTSVLPGQPLISGPQYLPIPIDEIVAEDRFGNRTEKTAPNAGDLRQEGSVGGALESGAVLQLRVRVVAADTLAPLELAVVQVAPHPFDPLGPAPVTKKTSSTGEVKFQAGELAAFGPTLSITAADKGYDLFTVAGIASPIGGDAFGVSLPLRRTGDDGVAVSVPGTQNIPIADANAAFLATASNRATPAPVATPSPELFDERFSIAKLATPATSLRVAAGRPVILSAVEFDGNGTFVPQAGPIRVFETPTSAPFSFTGAGSTALPISNTFANTILSIPEIETTGITPGLPVTEYLAMTHGRLVARLPGLEGVFPISISPMSFNPPGPGQPPSDPSLRVVFAPIPGTLWQNEALGDPHHERLIQPDAGIVTAAPSEAMLEEACRFEIEVAEKMDTQDASDRTVQRTRQTALLDFVASSTASTSEPIDLPTIPSFAITPNVHPLELTNLVHDCVPADSVLRVSLRAGSAARRWEYLVDAASVLAAGNVLRLPSSPVNPFADPGEFQVRVEVIEMQSGEFAIDSFVFSDLEREQRRAARSVESLGNTAPP